MDTLNQLKNLVKFNNVRIGNACFSLHYRVTCIMLLTFSLILTSRVHLGAPITCLSPFYEMKEMIEHYCWSHATYILPTSLSKKAGTQVAYPGLGSHIWDTDEMRKQSYYQWVSVTLFIQGLLFYMPYFIWKHVEGKRLQSLIGKLSDYVTPENVEEQEKYIVKFFKMNSITDRSYIIIFFLCEILNFVNVIGQLYFIDFFLGGDFSLYGLKAIELIMMTNEDEIDPMALVFPKVTKCTFRQYGSSGSIQNYEVICLLSVNYLNEKFYIVLWFWLNILAVLTALTLLSRIATIYSPRVRLLYLKSVARVSKEEELLVIIENFRCGHWFMLYQMGRNCNAINFGRLITLLANKITEEMNMNNNNVQEKNLEINIEEGNSVVVNIEQDNNQGANNNEEPANNEEVVNEEA